MKILHNLKEWIYQKQMIRPWPLLETLADASYVINPKFVVIGDYVFLDCGNDNLSSYDSSVQTASEKIETEALENHVHLFEGVKKCFQSQVKSISIAIAQNLSNSLKYQFPNRKFVVLLELNFKDSIIVRFHQIRDGEELYMDPKYYQDEYNSGFFMMFR